MIIVLKKTFDKLQDIHTRHEERSSSLGLKYALADSIEFLSAAHWDAIAIGQSIFLSRHYLRAIERCSPPNVSLRYAIIYDVDRPIAIVACQIADLSGDQFFELSETPSKRSQLLGKVRQRMLVCGNLISSG